MKTRLMIGIASLMVAAVAARAATASDNWTQHCASCHGADGAGKTKIGKKSGLKDLADAAYQKTFTDQQLLDHLKAGEKGDDGKVKMKPFGDKMTDAELQDMVKFVRAFQK
jgi:mono/diheme cytochrome c family protein